MENKFIFIVLNSAIKTRIVCDLAEKCFLNDQKTIIYVKDSEESKKFDSLLWTWKQQSFIPHLFVETLSSHHREPIVITNQIEDKQHYDTLLLVDPLPIEELLKFKTVIDFAERYDTSTLKLSRERYKAYREHNVNIETMQPGEFLHTAH